MKMGDLATRRPLFLFVSVECALCSDQMSDKSRLTLTIL